MNTVRKTDPFLLEVMRYAFDSVAEEITLAIVRTAWSQIVRDSLDFSTAICDAQGRTLAQGVCTPMHLGAFHDALTNLIEKASDDLHRDDVFIMNDPYAAFGQHLPDIYVVQPVFYQGSLRGWAATLAHHSDIGGIVAGSNSLGAREIWQEGLRIPVLKLVEKGKRNQTLWDLIELNVRTPKLVLGDLQAQISACGVGGRGLLKLYERYGVEVLEQAMSDLHDYALELAESEISDIPDGVYKFTDYIDGIGNEPVPVRLEVSVSIEGSKAIVDWSGSSSQIEGGINSTFPFTKACAYAALRSVMSADVPNCHGFTRAIEVKADLGSIVRPVSPGPCGARGITGYRMIDCLFGALAQAVPTKVTADGAGGSMVPTISGTVDGNIFVFCETAMGTWGASDNADGQEGMPHIGANQSNVPIEMIEKDYPLRINRYEFIQDSGGPGRTRGGLSIRREYRLLADKALLNVRSDKRKFPPHGLFGGSFGNPSMNKIVGVDGVERVLPVMLETPVEMKKGEIFSHIMASGGGYGSAFERDPEKVAFDALMGKVSVEGAARDYGVSLSECGGSYSVNIDQTTSFRSAQVTEQDY